MARLLTCGWETGSLTEMNGPNAGSVSVSETVVRSGRFSLSFVGGGIVGIWQKHVFAADEDVIFGRLAFYFTGDNLGDTTELLQFYDSAGTKFIELFFDPDTQTFRLRTFPATYPSDPALVPASGYIVVSMNNWYVLEWKLKVDVSAGEFIWKINSITDGSHAGDTKGCGNGAVRSFKIAAYNELIGYALQYVDDLGINNDVGPDQDSWLGLGCVTLQLPIADGPKKEWTPSSGTVHWDKVDDVPANTTDYVQSGTPGATELFQYAETPPYTTAIDVVQLVYQSAVSESGSQVLHDVMQQGTVEYEGGTVNLVNIAPGYQVYHGQPFYHQPNGGGDWDKASLDAIFAGVKIDV